MNRRAIHHPWARSRWRKNKNEQNSYDDKKDVSELSVEEKPLKRIRIKWPWRKILISHFEIPRNWNFTVSALYRFVHQEIFCSRLMLTMMHSLSLSLSLYLSRFVQVEKSIWLNIYIWPGSVVIKIHFCFRI